MMESKGMRVCARCGRNRNLKFYSGPRGRVCVTCQKRSRSKASHEARVTATYGLKPGEYDRLFEAQGGACAICGGKRRQRLSVDHDHKTGLVRGLCCRLCNGRLLTAARDRPEVLRAAADYLENPPALRLLGERYHHSDGK
ncbi:hypothetical protein ADL27_32410 [Streptomyces sp. NRRL F-6602]|nr:hypothetical protein ADL27_32410 [Streptomyces sp. NRRL F-6602]